MRAVDPTVSFVIPTRNEEGFLGQSLDSLDRLPSTPAWEVIVVDDRSSDRTCDIAAEFGVRLISGQDSGRGEGRHIGARHAGGEWLVFLDADTTVQRSYLDQMLPFLAENELCGGASQCRITGGWRTHIYELFYREAGRVPRGRTEIGDFRDDENLRFSNHSTPRVNAVTILQKLK